MRIVVRKRKRPDSAPALRESVERQLSLAADMGRSPHDDPLYRVDETFRESFQGAGRKRYEAATAEGTRDDEREEQEKPPKAEEALQEKGQKAEETQDKTSKQDENADKKKEGVPDGRQKINGAPLENFSKMAFKRGELSAAVLEGTGKVALISCLKRSAGQPEQGKTLFGLGAQTSNVPARDPDKMMFHRNFATSAVGLVVDALRDARRTVDSLTDMASGTGEFRERDGGATLHSMYPFLDDSRERALLGERQKRLQEGNCTPEERAILENAAIRAKALITKKAQMKEEFIQKLREISNRAEEAIAELERPETLEEAAEALEEADGTIPPPDKDAPSKDGVEETETPAQTDSATETETPSETDSAETATGENVPDA